jgi:hypothetical protein
MIHTMIYLIINLHQRIARLMNTASNLTLTPPAPFFGAVKGERKLSRSWFAWTAFAVLLLVLAATSTPKLEVFRIPISDANSGMYPTMWVFVVLWLFGWAAYTDDVLHAHEAKYAADIKRLRQEYFTKEVCPYIARKYDAQISEAAANFLFVGYPARLSVQGETRKVWIEGMGSVKRFAMGETTRFHPEDLILEEVIEPAATQFVPLKPVA